jgi:hypothetical protein
MPVDGLTVAMAVFALNHVPPETGCVNVIVSPTQTFVVPDIFAIAGLMLIVTVSKQPDGFVKVIRVVPTVRPVTTPAAETDARVGLLLVQVPPAGAPTKLIALPTHTTDGAVIVTSVAGSELTG